MLSILPCPQPCRTTGGFSVRPAFFPTLLHSEKPLSAILPKLSPHREAPVADDGTSFFFGREHPEHSTLEKKIFSSELKISTLEEMPLSELADATKAFSLARTRAFPCNCFAFTAFAKRHNQMIIKPFHAKASEGKTETSFSTT